MFAILPSLLLTQLSMAQAASAAVPPPSPPPRCETEAHAAFDFWVGQWDVYPAGGGDLVAHSTIERLHGGCAIREQWQPLGGGGGSSLSNLDRATGRWHQTWIDASGARVEFEGGATAEGAMVLAGYWPDIGGPGVDGLVRMTYTANADGSVRQHGEVSFDHGLSWSDSFDFLYRPSEKPTP